MADPPVPQAAMRAAAAAVPFVNRDAMRRIIEYAAPHIRAAEREACAQEIFHYADTKLEPGIGAVYRDAARVLLRKDQP